jgi:hypothetical protein
LGESALSDGLDGGLVLLDRDLALAQQDLAQAVVGQVRRGEDDAAVLEVERLARAARHQREDAGGLRQAEMLEDFRHGQLGDLALQTARHHERLEALRKSRCHQELVKTAEFTGRLRDLSKKRGRVSTLSAG